MLVAALASPASTQDWAHWGDSKAELNGYQLAAQYGASQSGGVLIFVTRTSTAREADPASIRDKRLPLEAQRGPRFSDRHLQLQHHDPVCSRDIGLAHRQVSFSSREWCGRGTRSYPREQDRGLFPLPPRREAIMDDRPCPGTACRDALHPAAWKGEF
jgi:hypothetical protein